MDKETTIEMALLMLDFAADRAEVEIRPIDLVVTLKWRPMSTLAIWDFDRFEYRRKPKPQEAWIWCFPHGNRCAVAYRTEGECVSSVQPGSAGKPVRFVEADQ